MFRDVSRSAVLGPLRALVPILGYAVVYPILLREAGLAVLGVWSLMSTTTVYMAMADVGFSLLLNREAGRDRSAEELAVARADYVAAARTYWLFGGLLLAALLAAGERSFAAITTAYPPGALLYSTAALVLAATVQLLARLDGAVLSARNDNALVLGASGLAPIASFVATAIGAFAGRPIEGLAAGTLGAAVVQLLLFRGWLRRRHPDWGAVAIDASWIESLRRLRRLLRRSWRFFAISAGFIFREPLFRGIVGVALGAEQVGVYDIAMRATRSLRDLVTVGFNSLLPGLAALHRTRQRDESRRLMRVSALFVMALGGSAMGALVLGANVLYPLWLDAVPPGLVSATRILALWVLLTLFNVPFFHLLQATGHESVIVRSVWLHTLSVLALLPLRGFVPLGLDAMLVFWTVAALPTQAMLYHAAEARLGLFRVTVRGPRVAAVVGLTLALMAFAWFAGDRVRWPGLSPGAAALAAAALAAHVVLVTILVLPPIREFVGSSGSSGSSGGGAGSRGRG